MRLADGEDRPSSSRPSYPRPCMLAHVLDEWSTQTTHQMMEELGNDVCLNNTSTSSPHRNSISDQDGLEQAFYQER
jgi:hypothetical protein